MRTRDSFRAALDRLRQHGAGDPARGPAFAYHLAAAPRWPVPPPRRTAPPSPVPAQLTLTGARGLLAMAQASAAELMADAYRAVDRWNAGVQAFEYLRPRAEALRWAADRDRRRPSPAEAPLWGLPLTVKDVIHVGGLPTTASSRTLPNLVPPRSADAVARLERAGALVIGKTTTHEFALGVTTPGSHNPWQVDHDPGGSSGGSAVAVASGMGLASLGTDTRGSIRVPAALCGVVGLKPTYGLVSTRGVLTLSWSMDHVGPITRTCADAALLLNLLAGPDAGDRRGVQRSLVDYSAFIGADVRGLRVGVPPHSLSGAEPSVVIAFERALRALEAAGVAVVEVNAPTRADFELANAAGLIVSRCEAAAFHRSLVGDDDRYTDDVREQLDEAGRVLALDYLQAQRLRSEFAERMATLLQGVDALAMPTSRVGAPPIADSEQYLLVLSENCVPWSFIGFPALTVPCGLTTARLPVGCELVARPWDDGLLLALGSAVETALGTLAPPPLAA